MQCSDHPAWVICTYARLEKSRRISIVHVVQLPIKEAVSRKFSQLSVHACVRVPVSACMCVCMHVSVRVYVCMSVHTHAPTHGPTRTPTNLLPSEACSSKKSVEKWPEYEQSPNSSLKKSPMSTQCRVHSNTSPFRAGTSVRSHLDLARPAAVTRAISYLLGGVSLKLGQRRQVAHNLIGQQHSCQD